MDVSTQRVESESEDGRRGIKSFVLRGTRLAPYQKKALELYSDSYIIPFSKNLIDFEHIFGNRHPVIIEIGFGMGYTTERIAHQMPSYNYIGIEVFLNGFTKLLSSVGRQGLEHVRLIRYDAVEVLKQMIPCESVAGFHIFFPDPWPKKKHHKRRLIQNEFVHLLAQKLQDNGYIYCVTDWEPYAHHMLETFARCEELENRYGGFAPSKPWRPTTNFEQKGLQKNHVINEIWVEKRSRA